MTTVADVLRIAAGEIGNRENPAGSNRTKYGSWYGMDGNAWCAMFVSYCFYNAGLPLPITTPKGFAYCPSGVAWFKASGKWIARGTSPGQPGDLIFFDWEANNIPEAFHVGIVQSIKPTGEIITIEGNATTIRGSADPSPVSLFTRKPDQTLLGFGRPTFNNVPSPIGKPGSPPWPGRFITLTSPLTKGSDVLLWQQQMIVNGATLGTGGLTGKGDDGTFGPISSNELIKLQQAKGLEQDGVIGPISWAATWS